MVRLARLEANMAGDETNIPSLAVRDNFGLRRVPDRLICSCTAYIDLCPRPEMDLSLIAFIGGELIFW